MDQEIIDFANHIELTSVLYLQAKKMKYSHYINECIFIIAKYMSDTSFEEFSSTPKWIKSYESIFGSNEICSDDLNMLRKEYNDLNGNQPSLSLIKNDVTWNDFIWCDKLAIYLLMQTHGKFNWDDESKMYVCTSKNHDKQSNEYLIDNVVEIFI